MGHGAGVWVFLNFLGEELDRGDGEGRRREGGGLEEVQLEGKAWVGEW